MSNIETVEYQIDLTEGSAQAADAIAFSAGGHCSYTNSVRGVKDVARVCVPAEQAEAAEKMMDEDDRVISYELI